MQLFRNSYRIAYLVVVGCLTAFFGYHCLNLRVDQDNRSMDADNDVQALIEKEFQDLFDEEDSILVAVQRAEILNESGRALILALEKEIFEIKGVERVASLTKGDFSVAEFHEGLLISKGRDMVGISIFLAEFADDGESLASAVKEIRSIAKRFSESDVVVSVTGLPLHKYEAGRLVLQDQKLFAPLSFLILGLVLFFITRKMSGLIIPLVIAGLTICWTLGLYSFLGYSLNMITSLLAPVIMTLSVTTTIHLYLHWLRGSESTNRKRIVAAVGDLYRPCLFASLTTAIGFLSLLTSHTPAVRLFGVFAATGVLISYVLGVSGIAVGLSFFRKAKSCPQKEGAILPGLLERVAVLSISHPGKIVCAAVVIALVSVIGLQKVRSNTDILRFLGADSELFLDTILVDETLTGVNVIELLIQRSDGEAFSTYAEVDEIRSFETAVEQLEHVKHCLSMADFLAESEAVQARARFPFEVLMQNIETDHCMSPDLKTARLTIRIGAIGTDAGARLIEGIREAATSILGESYRVREVGGFYRVISESNQLVASQLKSFAIAIGLILLSIGIVFRSVEYMFLAIIPNVIPLVMTTAIMGFFHIDLSTGTAMIASVVIGVAVDDTIHYLSAYRRAVKRLKSCHLALRETTKSTGFALLSTTLALSFGFWVAIFGSFQPTVYFALLSGLTMWFALACDLLVLPATINLFHSRRINR